MIERAFTAGVLAMAAGLVLPTATGAGEAPQQPAPIILNLMNRPVESREKAFNEEIKREALAPRPSPVDEWELQPDGFMRNKKTGISLRIVNPCPPGDIDHEFALAAYNRAKSRR
ncbi:MAG TPA: hypothetical protein VJX92_09530 [Methylomirabilota bacterium]|nr:hypothetical protein [Methylomirabilota bacterium]